MRWDLFHCLVFCKCLRSSYCTSRKDSLLFKSGRDVMAEQRSVTVLPMRSVVGVIVVVSPSSSQRRSLCVLLGAGRTVVETSLVFPRLKERKTHKPEPGDDTSGARRWSPRWSVPVRISCPS